MKKIIYMFGLSAVMLVLSNFVLGQFTIPRILKPKPPVQNPAPPGPNRQPGGKPIETSPIKGGGGDYIDDGYTWFEAVSTQELNAQHRPVTTYPNHSAFKFVVSHAGKQIGTTRCEARSYNIPRNGNPQDVSYIAVDGCYDKAEMTTHEIGKFDVEVSRVDGATNTERGIRKYKIEVVKVNRVNGQIGKFAKPNAPRYVVLRHAEMPVGILFLRPGGTNNYFEMRDGNTSASNQLEVYFNISPTKEGWGLPLAALKCSVDGKRIKLQEKGSQTDIVATSDFRSRMSYEIYSDRLAAPYSAGGPVYEDDFGFRVYRARLPLTYGTAQADPSRTNLKEYPGNWECGISDNGNVLRTWRWTVGANGMPVKHPEQNGNVNLFSNAYVIETEIPAGGTFLDKRLVPVSLGEGFFFGQKWTTPEGKAMAAKVPTKGNPEPIPSNRIK